MSMVEEGSCTRGQALNAMGAALLGIVGIVAAPSDSFALSSADVNRKLTK